jgi:nitrogen-specific signal transduction histidine kinase
MTSVLRREPPNTAPPTRTRVTNDIEIVRADGSVVYVQNDVEPLYDRYGNVCGCVSVCVDMTVRKGVEDVLRDADRRKDEFLATLSHELRNPLAPIRNALELMRRGGHDPELSERALAIIERQVQQLVRLTDDLLDVSRITRNKIELRRDRIDLRTVVSSAIETIEAPEPCRRTCGGRGPLASSAVGLRRLHAAGAGVAKLLNNAVKYTDRGGHITLSASVDAGEAVVILTDTGIGIDPALLPSIFDMFVQIEQGSSRARTDLGIGLALTRRLIELHEGHIEAHSGGPGTGATFTVRLPVVAHAGEEKPTVQVARSSRRCRVLVADDIPDAAEMMRLMLECMAHEVRVAADGVQAVEMPQEFDSQIALLDIGMPEWTDTKPPATSAPLLAAAPSWSRSRDGGRRRTSGAPIRPASIIT